MTTRERFSNAVKAIVIVTGALCFAFAFVTLPPAAISLGYLSLLAFSLFISPRMTLTLPRSKFAISFADTLIFVTFLLYGGEGAIILAAAETLANCLHLKNRGFSWGRLMIPTNVSINVIATAVTFLVWLVLGSATDSQFTLNKTQHLITLLGILALSQFCVSSLFAAVFHSLKDGTNLWETWKKYCFSSSMTQIVGAGLAGIIFKLFNYGDLVTALVALIAIGIAFLNYRQSIGEINTAISQVEEAEREKAETERERRREAERYASELSVSLEKEERSNVALRKSERDFQHAALHDSLTGLANRKQFGDILRGLIEDYKRDPTTNFQVLFLDIRSFKNINDSLGHTIGDKVLVIAAKRFVRMLNAADTVARIGGDEFAIILRDLSSVAKAQKVARRIYQSLTQPFSLSGNKISIDLNIGIAPCDAEYDTPEEILRDADIAMHYAKERNDGPAVFTKELRSRFLERVRYEMDLRHAIDRDELAMNYQPIISLSDGRLIGFEALLRWHHAEFGTIPPTRFIPIAEESGLIQPITVWILNQTCMQLAKWQKISPDYENLIVSVNISGKHLSKDDLITDVLDVLQQSRLEPGSLKLEITESVAMENAEHTINVLNKLKEIGVQLSIDDFGTGYSSLSHLHRLPFDTLKIDRSFVCRVGERGENSEVLQTVISLAKNLKMRVIAEGIETPAQLAVLQNLGCDYGQGYLMAKPKPREETEDMLYSRPNWLPGEQRRPDLGNISQKETVESDSLSLH
ncbi:MAG: bifunctional diguanylate cyclase/phosphodiesterase [Pyrinomonadaceae bacterium]